MYESNAVTRDVAPGNTLLGLLQRGRGDGAVHALAAGRAEALSALDRCVSRDPRADWRLESRSLYYARLYTELEAGLDGIAGHLFCPADSAEPHEERTGLALSVLGHLARYGRRDAADLLRRYVAGGANWTWALDELADGADEDALRALLPAVHQRVADGPDGDRELAEAVRRSWEGGPWRLWATHDERVRRAVEQLPFERWRRQLSPEGPAGCATTAEVLHWAARPANPDQAATPAAEPYRRAAAAARRLTAVATTADLPALLDAAATAPPAARAAALLHLAAAVRAFPERLPAVLDAVEQAAACPDRTVSTAAVDAVGRLPGAPSLDRARAWAQRRDALGTAAACLLADHGTEADAAVLLDALQHHLLDPDARGTTLARLVEGTGRLAVTSAVPLLRHVYRETTCSHLRGRAAEALAATDPDFATGTAVECLWDCEEATRELGARHAPTRRAGVLERLRRLLADPMEEAEVHAAVLGRLSA
ncbi:HEAT repeat domain-containing protein [Allostreptomyces psammosilenae]|uniref:HEAT repeat domain-containing protein n=1 Tax=Allostreptomyces psammosilenae TaxID=1892865 RepID=A0A853A3N3_9ACTN|nr:HEAT repeat domain-containing protein [Allostreptomyces psammosilenae]NYI07484.1 hypothetical protein [Allostreptomyces psammosilenae]